jgi:hypothetical protein
VPIVLPPPPAPPVVVPEPPAPPAPPDAAPPVGLLDSPEQAVAIQQAEMSDNTFVIRENLPRMRASLARRDGHSKRRCDKKRACDNSPRDKKPHVDGRIFTLSRRAMEALNP